MTAESRAPEGKTPRRMLGRYELLAEIGSGAMGTVFLGRLQCSGGFERLFAIKVVHKHLAQKPKIIEMLGNEARLAAQIQHPNVVGTVDAEISTTGQNYVVMDYVDGFTLCELLDHPKLDAVRRVRLGLRILLGAMAGLDAAHRLCSPADGTPLKIVHRDVSPSNILVNLAGSGLIADFGIARAAAYRVSTLPGVLKGTPCYMAPEQASGSDDIDARADVFALGAVLWEVLTGEQLFYSPTGIAAVLERVLNDKIEAPTCRNSRLPTAIDAVCLKALERSLDERYQSVAELLDDLGRVVREHDLIASTHELAEALSQLFADAIEKRRACLAQVMETKRDTDPPGPPPVVAPPPMSPETASAIEAFVTAAQLPELESERGSGEAFDSELAALRKAAPRWPLAALAACAALAASALVLGSPRSQNGATGAALPAAHAAPAFAKASAPKAPELQPVAAKVAAPTAELPPAEPALDPRSAIAAIIDPERGEDSSPPAETKEERKARFRAERALELAARGRVRAPRPAAPVATAQPAAAAGVESLMAARDRTRGSVLEKNPYLMQR